MIKLCKKNTNVASIILFQIDIETQLNGVTGMPSAPFNLNAVVMDTAMSMTTQRTRIQC